MINTMTITTEIAALYTCATCATCATYFHGGHRDPAVRAHRREHVAKMVAGLRMVWATGDRERFLRCAQKATRLMSSYTASGNLWACALTLVYGPTGMHSAWSDADGHPSAAALALPAVQRTMARAEARVAALLDTLERDALREQG